MTARPVRALLRVLVLKIFFALRWLIVTIQLMTGDNFQMIPVQSKWGTVSSD